MINSLKIQNFQNHQKSIFDFSDGLNVVYGENDQGKSAVLRALNWIVNNKPSGFGFQPKNKPESTTSVSIKTHNHEIIRKRNKKDNCYLLDDITFSALRSEVPKEITDILNLSQFSYQSQYNPHFLFTDSAGEVAKKINKIVGLEEIDVVLSKIKSLKETNNRDIKYLTDEIIEAENKITKYSTISPLWDKAQLIQKREDIVQKKLDSYEKGIELIEEYEEIQNEINEIQALLKHKNKFLKTLAIYDEIVLAENQKKIISDKITYIISLTNQVKNYEILLQQNTALVEIEKVEKTIQELEIEKIHMQTNTEQLEKINYQLKERKIKIKQINTEYENLKKKLKICPLCEKPF